MSFLVVLTIFGANNEPRKLADRNEYGSQTPERERFDLLSNLARVGLGNSVTS